MRRCVLAIILVLFTFSAQAATVTSGSLTVTQTKTEPDARLFLNCVTLDWLSDASGNCTASLTEINGTIERIVFNPDDGATSPTAAYDVTLKDVDDVDVLNGKGANLSASATTSVVATSTDSTTYLPMAALAPLSLAVTNAGASNGGIIRIYFRR